SSRLCAALGQKWALRCVPKAFTSHGRPGAVQAVRDEGPTLPDLAESVEHHHTSWLSEPCKSGDQRRHATKTRSLPHPWRKSASIVSPRSDAGRRRWQASWPRMWHTSETPVIGIEDEECRAQPEPADKLLSMLRRMALLGCRR